MKKLLAMIVTVFLFVGNPTTASADINITNTSTTSVQTEDLNDYIKSKTAVNQRWATFIGINNVLLITCSIIAVCVGLVKLGSSSSN
jgi:hypothetical protein